MSRFYGTHTRTIDDKQRLPLPRAFRNVLGEGDGIVTRLGGALVLFAEDVFDEMVARLEDDVRAGVRSMDLLRGVTTNAYPVRPDAQNRIKLPRRLLEEDELNGELVLSGTGLRVEIRPPARYEPIGSAADQAAAREAEDLL